MYYTIRVILGKVSVIFIFRNNSTNIRCSIFYDFDGTVMVSPIPKRLRLALLQIYMNLPIRLQLVLEKALVIKKYFDKPRFNTTPLCILTARTVKTFTLTINELIKYNMLPNILVMRKPFIPIQVYYRLVVHDLYKAGITVSKIIIDS